MGGRSAFSSRCGYFYVLFWTPGDIYILIFILVPHIPAWPKYSQGVSKGRVCSFKWVEMYLKMVLVYFRIKAIIAVTVFYKFYWVNQMRPGEINTATSENFYTRFPKFQFLLLRKVHLFIQPFSLFLCIYTYIHIHILYTHT